MTTAKLKPSSYDHLLYDILLLVVFPPPPIDEVAAWTKEQKEQAEKWAAKEHLRASDNNVRRLPRPDFIKEGPAVAQSTSIWPTLTEDDKKRSKPKRKQFRRSISVSVKMYNSIFYYCHKEGISMSGLVEEVITSFLDTKKPDINSLKKVKKP